MQAMGTSVYYVHLYVLFPSHPTLFVLEASYIYATTHWPQKLLIKFFAEISGLCSFLKGKLV